MRTIERPSPDGMVRARLEGGPADLPPDQRDCFTTTGTRKIKIAHRGGYEHFERDADPAEPLGPPVVFRWTARTRIAE